MLAISCTAFAPDGGGLRLAEAPTPELADGEVLVEVECASVHPADLMMIAGTYHRGARLPFGVGLTGVGRVVRRRGGGLVGRLIDARRVAFALPEGRFGTWAQYAATTPDLCFPLSDALGSEAATNLLANAASAVGLVERVRALGGGGAVVTAAAGDLGRLVCARLRERGLAAIATARRAEQVELLRRRGEAHVLHSAAPDFDEALGRLAHALGVRVAVDTVAGELPARLLAALPQASTVIAVGRLSGAPIRLDAMQPLIARGGRLEGFNVGHWFASKSTLAAVLGLRHAQRLLLAAPPPPAQRRLGLEEVVPRFGEVTGSTTAGKTLIVM